MAIRVKKKNFFVYYGLNISFKDETNEVFVGYTLLHM